MFSFILDVEGGDCNIECINHVFIPISSGSENSSKRTQRMSFSAAVAATLASSEQCSTLHRFRLINGLHSNALFNELYVGRK